MGTIDTTQCGIDAPPRTPMLCPAHRSARRKKVGVIELIAYTVSSEWLPSALVSSLKRQYYSVMPQVVSVWCRELGHDVTYATYFGQADPMSLLPHDLDVVFIAASTQASALAYVLAKLYRHRGVLTVAGGPHAKCFPEDCARFFDLTVTSCDRELVDDILSGRLDLPAVVGARRPLQSFPTVEERLPEIRVAAFHRGRPMKTSVVSLFGSTGCPYSCNFCTDWNSTYTPVPAGQLAQDLRFVAQSFPSVLLGFQDPNFGVRFDATMDALESVPAQRRCRYLMQCSLAILNETRMKRLADTRCLYVAPGIESWSAYGNKMRMTTTQGRDRVTGIVEKFCKLRDFVPGLQANFVFGLDGDIGSEPFDLTREFIARVPFVWPNINILTPYGATPVYDKMLSEGCLLRAMPLALYCSPYLSHVLGNYDPIEFYDRAIDLLAESTSAALTARRMLLRDDVAIKIARLAQTRAVRRDLREMRRIRAELRKDATLRAFHQGRTNAVPAFYNHHLDQRLGPYAELLTVADRIPIHVPGAENLGSAARSSARISPRGGVGASNTQAEAVPSLAGAAETPQAGPSQVWL